MVFQYFSYLFHVFDMKTNGFSMFFTSLTQNIMVFHVFVIVFLDFDIKTNGFSICW